MLVTAVFSRHTTMAEAMGVIPRIDNQTNRITQQLVLIVQTVLCRVLYPEVHVNGIIIIVVAEISPPDLPDPKPPLPTIESYPTDLARVFALVTPHKE